MVNKKTKAAVRGAVFGGSIGFALAIAREPDFGIAILGFVVYGAFGAGIGLAISSRKPR